MTMAIIFNLAATVKNQSTIYYMQYYLERPELTSSMLTVPNLFLLLTLVLAPLISKRMGKRNSSLLGMGVSVLGSLLVLVSGRSVPLLFAGSIVTALGLGIPFGILGAMFADTVDYLEWKSGVRSTGLVYSASSIGIKMGQGLGGALGAAVLALGHYVPNVVQSASSLAAIRFNYAWVALIAVLLLAVALYFYRVDQVYSQIQEDLKARRASAAPGGE
jgi:Na+/melibiose symporter-like transporter